ncbi:MAG: metalloregulator ArsR/SmtB family transcription factor [Hyphomonadaceae bacterium]
MSDVYKALAHPTRRDILSMLARDSYAAGDIAAHLKIANSTLSGHLNILKNASLIDVERRGVTLIFRINVSVAEETTAHLMSLFRVGETSAEKKTPSSKKRAPS